MRDVFGSGPRSDCLQAGRAGTCARTSGETRLPWSRDEDRCFSRYDPEDDS